MNTYTKRQPTTGSYDPAPTVTLPVGPGGAYSYAYPNPLGDAYSYAYPNPLSDAYSYTYQSQFFHYRHST